MTRQLTVTIITDTVCPWCYVGKKRFERAVTSFKLRPGFEDVEFKLTYQPFQLNPAQSKEGEDKIKMYERKFGKARYEQMMGHLKQVGVAEGIQFSSGGMIGNSLDSHRLVKFAGLLADQKQDAVINRLYRAYFEEEKNIADSQVLVSIAESAGLDGAKVREMLAGDHLLKETQDAVDQVHASGVSGVPFFIVGDKFAVSGAQDPAAFEAVFERALGAV
ncbi:hypothetical protein HDU78_006954 [Chytriomyces hyalinus]|nr:hypothetical protein HDU78_006954 [Chytriomyces hyalinus]